MVLEVGRALAPALGPRRSPRAAIHLATVGGTVLETIVVWLLTSCCAAVVVSTKGGRVPSVLSHHGNIDAPMPATAMDMTIRDAFRAIRSELGTAGNVTTMVGTEASGLTSGRPQLRTALGFACVVFAVGRSIYHIIYNLVAIQLLACPVVLFAEGIGFVVGVVAWRLAVGLKAASVVDAESPMSSPHLLA